MEFVILVPLLTFAAGFAALLARVGQQQRDRTYRQAAERLGITWHASRVPFAGRGPGVSGAFQGFRVSTEEFVVGRQRGVRVTVDGVGTPAGSVPAVLGLERERTTLGMLGGEDVIVGDPGFDERVRVRGGAAVALAALGREARRAFLDALGAGDTIVVRRGTVVTERRPLPEAGDLAASIRRAVRVARHLAVGVDGIAPALARRAVSDHLPGVRLQALEALAGIEGEGERTRRTAGRLLGDRDPEVRLRGAVHAGEQGYEALVGIVRTPAGSRRARGPAWWRYELAEALDRSPEGSNRRRARALDHLVAGFPPGRVQPLLAEALQGGPAVLRAAALRGVATAGDASFEEAVLPLLGHADDAVRDAAVAALGAVGTAAAVPALRALASGSGGLEFQLRRAVDAAVAAIHARLGPAAAGQLSLAHAGAGGGEVSLAVGAGGAAGRLSPAARG